MQTKTFVVDTPVFKKYGASKGQVLGYARIEGKAEYKGGPYFDRDYCDLTVTKVLLKVGLTEADMTLAYGVSKQLNDTLAELIEDAALAHCEYLFATTEAVTHDLDHTDTVQDTPYSVIAMAERREDVTLITPVNEKAA